MPSTRTSKPTLNPKQALFVSYLTKPGTKTFGNAYASAVKAGYSDSYALKITAVLSENVRLSMTEALAQAGVTTEVLAERHLELLNKREVVVARTGKDSEAILTNQPDTQAAKAGLELAYRLRGDFAPEQHEHTHSFEDLLDEAGDPPADPSG